MSIVQHRAPRLVIGTLVPGVVFAFLTSVVIAVGIDLSPIPAATGSLPGFIGLVLSSWIFGGIQSLIYSVLMEFSINQTVKSDRVAIIVSGLLIAFATGLVIPDDFPLLVLGIGAASGGITGYVLRDLYKHYS